MPDRPNGFDGSEEPSPLGAAATLPAGPAARPPKDKSARRFKFPARTSLVLIIVIVVLLAFVPAIASGLKKTPRDRVGISYGGGPIEGSHFQRVVQPGHALFFNGMFDPLYLYPSDQQAYIVSKTKGEGSVAGSDSIIAPSKDRVQIDYQVAAYFKLNTDKLREFHEQLGLRYNASTSAGWTNLIRNTFRQQLESAIQQETRRYNTADIYGNDELLQTLQTDVQSSLSERLKSALGDDYFCGPTYKPGGDCPEITFVIKKIDLPKSVVAAFEAQRNSEIAVATEQNNTERRAVEAQGIQALANSGVSGQDYVLLKGIEAGNIKFWVLPTDSGLTLQSPDSGTDTSTTTAPTSGG